MNDARSEPLVVCAGDRISSECSWLIANAGLGNQPNGCRFVLCEWLNAEQFCRASLLWILDNSEPWDEVYFALHQGIPLLVPESNTALRDLCQRAGCGVWYRSESEAQAYLEYLLEGDAMCKRLGGEGRTYVSSKAFGQSPHSLAAHINSRLDG